MIINHLISDLHVDEDAVVRLIQLLVAFGLHRKFERNLRLPRRKFARLGDLQRVVQQLDRLQRTEKNRIKIGAESLLENQLNFGIGVLDATDSKNALSVGTQAAAI